MNRRDLLLVVLASAEGRSFTPVQLQKSVFLISRNVPSLIDSGPTFNFTPYDYGPFDPSVYSEAVVLQLSGHVVIAPSASGRWSTYAASDAGVARGRALLAGLEANIQDYIRRISDWVRSLSFRDLVKSIYDAYPAMKENSVFRG
jgi:uncharacterized protein